MSELDSNPTSGGGASGAGDSSELSASPGVIDRLKGHRFAQALQGDGLRAKALRGSGWTIAGFGASQVLRLGSNLILTRLLFPEAFGLMALAQVFLQGLGMLSDIGVGPSIVQNKRGDDPDFLATAWTMQVVRGFVLFLGMCVLAYPVSLIYDEPLLFPILIWIGLTAIIQGFQSIGFATASRKMVLGRLTMIDLVAQGAGIGVMIAWAQVDRTVWALVAGGLCTALFRLGLGHVVLSSSANRFRFDRSAAGEIFRFGKWIFLATACTYFGGQGLRLVQGYLVPIDILGMISIAGMLAIAADQLSKRIGGAVLFPAFAHIHQHRPHALAGKLREARTKLFIGTVPLFAILILFGYDLVGWLYDDRYAAAGGFLVLSATGAAIASVRTPFGMVLIATGDSFGHAVIMVVTACVRVGAVFVGFWYNGVVGMLVADIVAQGVIYPFEIWRLRPKGLWFPLFDGAAFLGYLVLGWIGYVMGPFFH